MVCQIVQLIHNSHYSYCNDPGLYKNQTYTLFINVFNNLQ